MRAAAGLIFAAAFAMGTAVWPDSSVAAAPCSVFARHPCQPPNTGCSVFQRRPCIPEIEYPIGQDLRLTIESASADQPKPPEPEPGASPAQTVGGDGNDTDGSPPPSTEHKLNTIMEMYGALRKCWIPPAQDEARPGMQMSVRLSFKRTGEIIGPPRVTYTSPDAPPEARTLYHDAITQALERCAPMPFSAGLGGAVAGRPINIRYVDNRKPAQ
jgi:hypothetical protein